MEAGLDRPSVVNCDGLQAISRTSLRTYVGSVSEATMERVCAAVGYALDCWGVEAFPRWLRTAKARIAGLEFVGVSRGGSAHASGAHEGFAAKAPAS